MKLIAIFLLCSTCAFAWQKPDITIRLRQWTLPDGTTVAARFIKANAAEHQITVRGGGKEYVLDFLALPREQQRWATQDLGKMAWKPGNVRMTPEKQQFEKDAAALREAYEHATGKLWTDDRPPPAPKKK